MVHGPFQFLCETNEINKSILRGSCYPNPQEGIPTGTGNSKPAYFPMWFLDQNVISWGNTIKCVLYVLWSRDSNKNSNDVSPTVGGWSHRRLSPLCSNQSFTIRLVQLSPHQFLIHGSNLANPTTYPWSNRINFISIPPKLSPLERQYIPVSILTYSWYHQNNRFPWCNTWVFVTDIIDDIKSWCG